MKHILIPNKKGYKANLHCHTTDSDGRFTPEEVVKHYKDHGYSILAITDHLYMRDRTSLSSNDFIVLNGYENNIIDWDSKNDKNNIGKNPLESRCYHFNFYSPKPDLIGMVGVVKTYHDFFNRTKTQEDKDLCPIIGGYYPEIYSKELAQKCINEALELGYIICYNHPDWSIQDQKDFCGLKGLFAMEMVNGGSFLGGYLDDNEFAYDAMLRDGQHICCLANDDNHNLNPNFDDSFIGFNIMFPEKLTYESVFDCLKKGNLYCSTGPLFKEIYIENNVVHISTIDDARYIKVITNGRLGCRVRNDDKELHELSFELKDKNITYIRIVMQDKKGYKAFTRAYFVGEDFVWE